MPSLPIWKRNLWVVLLAALAWPAARSFAQDLGDPSFLQPALEVSRAVQMRHLPFDTITDPVFSAPDSDIIVMPIANHGDSAIWSGHYLAAESYRYAVTGDAEAVDFALRVLGGIHRLINVGDPGLLARFAIPVDSPFADAVVCRRGTLRPPLICTNPDCRYEDTFGDVRYRYADNVSRDQYLGVVFGLAVAYELLPDESAQMMIREDMAAIIDYLDRHNWTVTYRDRCISTTFVIRPEQILSILQVGKRVWPERLGDIYERNARNLSSLVSLPILTELADRHNSYFKFNLDHISLFHLVRLETDPVYYDRYFQAFMTLREGLRDHMNAHFNAMEIGVTGDTDGALFADTREFLRLWLRRPRRDVPVRNSPRCGQDLRCIADPSDGRLRAADPLPILDRPTTDFLWQRSPFQLDGGGDGRMEQAGVDYVLPYWMLRYYREVVLPNARKQYPIR